VRGKRRGVTLRCSTYRDGYGRSGAVELILLVDEGVGMVFVPRSGLGAAAGLHAVCFVQRWEGREGVYGKWSECMGAACRSCASK